MWSTHCPCSFHSEHRELTPGSTTHRNKCRSHHLQSLAWKRQSRYACLFNFYCKTQPTHRMTPLSSSSRMPSTSSVAVMRATACMPGEVKRGREGDALILPHKGAATSCCIPKQPQMGGDIAEMLCCVPGEAPRGARLCRIPWQHAKGGGVVMLCPLHQGDVRAAVLCCVPGEAQRAR